MLLRGDILWLVQAIVALVVVIVAELQTDLVLEIGIVRVPGNSPHKKALEMRVWIACQEIDRKQKRGEQAIYGPLPSFLWKEVA